ncbi:MAG: hypothetical protein NTX75_03690 [Proteobacteria bacterium]|nr:hypothetical protein [Pseudomonadota bacterium]
MIRKKVRPKRSLKVRLKNKLSFSLGKEKIIYIIIGIILAALVAKALIWYIQKTEEYAFLSIHQYAASKSEAVHGSQFTVHNHESPVMS